MTTEMLNAMIEKLTDALKDAGKVDSGNKAARTRVRKVMQEIKSDAQNVRIYVRDLNTEE